MGMTHPSHTPPRPSSMTSITGYTTSRAESAAGHPHTYPPTGAVLRLHCLLSLSLSLSCCCQNKTYTDTKITLDFQRPDLHLTAQETLNVEVTCGYCDCG
ncbi:hypothetical protein XENOCAPTIV_003925 [Xenoophorus captivus]|uniref:Uncharacterized protein n=1 Tax=Xenoophorus captivus TaxID=1517983 RepID=A0ABV0Q8T7_9TELE